VSTLVETLNLVTETHVVMLFKEVFAELRPGRAMALEQLYAPDVVFEDPLHTLHGLPELRRYFERLNANLEVCHFVFEEQLVGKGEAMLVWTIKLEPRHSSKLITIAGVSHLQFADKITKQRDYFDAGALIYEHIPILGSVVRAIKSKV
jgi:limonene-1,2-epoxide hydrolase